MVLVDSLEGLSSGRFLVTVVSKDEKNSDYIVDLDMRTISSTFVPVGHVQHEDANCVIESGTVGTRFVYSFRNPNMPAVRFLPVISNIIQC